MGAPLFKKKADNSLERIMPETVATAVLVEAGGTQDIKEYIDKAVISGGQQPHPTTIGSQVHLSSQFTTRYTYWGSPPIHAWEVQIDNWKDEYADFDSYRLCLMQARYRYNRNKGVGYKRWRVPMFYELHPHPEDDYFPDADLSYCAFPPVRRMRLADDIFNKDKTKLTAINRFVEKAIRIIETDSGSFVFEKARRRKSHIGVALFKHTGEGQFGWERISNIAGMESIVNELEGTFHRRVLHEV